MVIAKLEPSQHVAERWLVWLEDGSFIRITENEVVSFALYEGMEVSDELYDALVEKAQRSAVRGKALDMVAAKPMSRRELVDKLTAKRPKTRDGRERPPLADEALANETADWLEELGYLNDAEYAKQVVKHYSAKGYGEHKLKDELFRRGVPKELWDAALLEAVEPEDGIDEFLRKRFKGCQPDQKELKRASDALARRGYRWNEIREGLNRYGADIEEE